MALVLGQTISNSQQADELNDILAAIQPRDNVQPFAPIKPLVPEQSIARPVPIIQHEISSIISNPYLHKSSPQDNIISMIVGGKEVNPSFKYGFQVFLQDNKSPFCGGTLYKYSILISPAHYSPSGEGSGLNGIEAVIHHHNITKTDEEENEKRFKVVKTIRYPKFSNKSLDHDIAI